MQQQLLEPKRFESIIRFEEKLPRGSNSGNAGTRSHLGPGSEAQISDETCCVTRGASKKFLINLSREYVKDSRPVLNTKLTLLVSTKQPSLPWSAVIRGWEH